MEITYDPGKRHKTLEDRGLDFADAGELFAGVTLDVPDDRQDYGEPRIRTVGHLAGRMLMIVWTPRAGSRHVISMRKCNEREQKRFEKRLRES